MSLLPGIPAFTPTAVTNALQKVPVVGGSATAASASLGNLGTLTIPTLPADYEWIYPNTQDGKYFTSTQAQIYVGNLFIDELVNLQFAYQGNRIPVYGYSSRNADAFGNGRRLVQGQIAINFVTEGYLYTVLKEYSKLFNQTVSSPALQEDLAAQVASLTAQIGMISTNMQGQPASAQGPYQEQIDAMSAQIQSLVAQGGQDVIVKAKQMVEVQQNTASAIELDIPFDIVCALTGAGRTVQKTLKNCLLISNEQVYDQSGTTLLDCYGFVARSSN